ncbi:LysR substrate-binding domain-containing protein, partial [Roseibium sediminicola]|nr:hypothetical protein [Roseibium sp. CAU 1639]
NRPPQNAAAAPLGLKPVTRHNQKTARRKPIKRQHCEKCGLGRSGLSYRSAYSSFSHSALVTLVEAGLAVAAVAQMAVPPTVDRLGVDQDLPPMDPLDIILVRSKAATSAPCEALAEALLEEAI